MDCSPPVSTVHGIFQARILVWVAIPFQEIFPTQTSNPGLLHSRQILYQSDVLKTNQVLNMGIFLTYKNMETADGWW